MNSNESINKDILIKTSNINLIISNNYLNLVRKIKVINKNSIFLTGIPINIKITDLYRYEYLGQYGKIVSIIQSKIKSKSKLSTYSVFVNFKSKISSAIAINSLNNFKLCSKVMKCSFATNKVCIDKLFGKTCYDHKCYFYHGQIHRSNSIIKIWHNTNTKIIEFFSNKSIKLLNKNYKSIISHYHKISMENTILPNVNIFISNFFKKNLKYNISTDVDSKKKIENYLVSFKKLIKDN